MKKIIPLLATLALAPGCRDECLEQNRDAAIRIVQEFNHDRCRAILDGDHRELICPSGTIRGELNGRVFDLEMDCGRVQIQLQDDSAALVCGRELELVALAPQICQQFEAILAELEVD